MVKQREFLGLQTEFSLPKWFGRGYQIKMRAIWTTLLGISCWTAVAWLVWNHVLPEFLTGAGFFLSLGLGSFLHIMSVVLADLES
ncbi:MAG: hypothetical protein P4L55_16190 [Syntrophobacteraceae bacterium]|nr:hypothetical protein [Syntrophobacteraceae bacterium]